MTGKQPTGRPAWRKSTYTNPSGNCVEVAAVDVDDAADLPAEAKAAIERKTAVKERPRCR